MGYRATVGEGVAQGGPNQAPEPTPTAYGFRRGSPLALGAK